MNITAKTPQPKQPKKEGRNYVSWIIFLLILARPLWGVLRSVVSPNVSSQQVLMIVAGVVALGAVVAIAMRARDGRPSVPQLPPSYDAPRSTMSTSSPYKPSRSTLPTPPRPSSSAMPRPPQFEPAITGTVVLVGIIVAAVISGVIGYVLLVST